MLAAASSLSLFLTVIYREEADDRIPNTHCIYQTPAPQSTLDSHLATSHMVQSLRANTLPIIASPGTRLHVIALKPEPSFFFSRCKPVRKIHSTPTACLRTCHQKKKRKRLKGEQRRQAN